MFLIAAVLLASAQPVADPQAATPVTPAPKKEKKICRTLNTTGSRLGGDRVCKTKAEWDADSEETRQQVERALDQPSGTVEPR
jgi:hypothetical protein